MKAATARCGLLRLKSQAPVLFVGLHPKRAFALIGLRIVSEANVREHWAKRAKRVKMQRALLAASMATLDKSMPCTVTLVRVAPRPLDDDNLRSALKACRDGIADALGIADNDPRVQWRYSQRRGEPREYSLEIEVTKGAVAA